MTATMVQMMSIFERAGTFLKRVTWQHTERLHDLTQKRLQYKTQARKHALTLAFSRALKVTQLGEQLFKKLNLGNPTLCRRDLEIPLEGCRHTKIEWRVTDRRGTGRQSPQGVGRGRGGTLVALGRGRGSNAHINLLR
jgi:hypothetical protein